jgi:predicted nucleic acid-binding protein
VIRQWLADGEKFGASAVARSEFCNNPLTAEQMEAIFAMLEQRVYDFTWRQAEDASRLFHRSGRRGGSHADCMIADADIAARVAVATRNVKDFERFVPFGLKLRAAATIPGEQSLTPR